VKRVTFEMEDKAIQDKNRGRGRELQKWSDVTGQVHCTCRNDGVGRQWPPSRGEVVKRLPLFSETNQQEDELIKKAGAIHRSHVD
jgi:hypothetical protein